MKAHQDVPNAQIVRRDGRAGIAERHEWANVVLVKHGKDLVGRCAVVRDQVAANQRRGIGARLLRRRREYARHIPVVTLAGGTRKVSQQ